MSNQSIIRTIMLAATYAVTMLCWVPRAMGEPARPAEPPAVKVDLNQASQAELESLPAIGPTRAKAILAYRARRPFRHAYELMRIHGIGRKTFRMLSDRVTIAPIAAAAPTSTKPKAEAQEPSVHASAPTAGTREPARARARAHATRKASAPGSHAAVTPMVRDLAAPTGRADRR